MASEDYPYVLWNEYTGLGNGYGGQLYWSYGDLGWPSGANGSFTYPELVDLLWDERRCHVYETGFLDPKRFQ